MFGPWWFTWDCLLWHSNSLSVGLICSVLFNYFFPARSLLFNYTINSCLDYSSLVLEGLEGSTFHLSIKRTWPWVWEYSWICSSGNRWLFVFRYMLKVETSRALKDFQMFLSWNAYTWHLQNDYFFIFCLQLKLIFFL